MKIAHPRLTSVNLREQAYPMPIAFVFEKNIRRRTFFGRPVTRMPRARLPVRESSLVASRPD